MIKFFDYSIEYKKIEKKILKNIKKILDSGILILDNKLERLENNIASFIGQKFAIGVNSGTDALTLGLRAFGFLQNSEVITVSNTTVPTIAAVRNAGLTPVFIDINPDTFQIDETKIIEKINNNTKAIVVVHLYGYPAAIDKIIQICKKYKLKLVEDCAQAFGSKYNNKYLGSFGDISCFSFYPTKNLSAYGDAGMCLTSNTEYYNNLKLLRFYGYKENKPISYIEGFNSRLDEIQAAILNVKLKYFDNYIFEKKRIANIYFENIENAKIVLPPKIEDVILHLFVIRTKYRDELIKYLYNKGIETKIHYPMPVHLMPAYSFLNYKQGSLPKTEFISKQILSLPFYYGLSKTNQKTIIYALNNF